MRLYKDSVLLGQAVEAAARFFKVDPSIVEKDYYVSVFLKRLTKSLPDFVLTGSFPLFKCRKVIQRFPESLDLAPARDPVTKGQRKQVKKAVTEVCTELGFALRNADAVKSSRDRNCYVIDYSPKKPAAAVNPVFLVKTDFSAGAGSFETLPVSSMIGDFMRAAGREAFIRQYKLEPFPVPVQAADRALIDAVFALCDSYLDGRVPGHAHYLYDISRLSGQVPLDADFVSLFETVRTERKSRAGRFPSAGDRYGIPELLSKILDEEVYKSDYRAVTSRILLEEISYEQAAAEIRRLIERPSSPDSGPCESGPGKTLP